VASEKISIIIPCFNEEEGIEQLKEQLDSCVTSLQQRYELEVLFIDDGSTDATAEKIKTVFVGLENKKIIQHKTNQGVGAAQRTGFQAASGDIICTMDSDCTYDPIHLVEMVAMIGEKVDFVTGSPYHPSGTVEGVPEYRLFLSNNLSRLYNLLFGLGVYTYTAIFRVYKKEVIKNIQLEADGFISSAEILLKSLLNGYKLKEYPTVLKVRKYGSSKIKILMVIRDHLNFILKMKLSSPRRKN
jgi:dolichol-phosphate mannosyltransferase